MRRYFFQIHGERGTDQDLTGIALSDESMAMLRAVTMCAEIGCSSGFFPGFAVSVRDEHGAPVGRVSVIVATAASEHDDA